MSARRFIQRCACGAASLVRRSSRCARQVGKWTAALGSRKFMGGDRPNLAGTPADMRVCVTASNASGLADIAFFGVLRAVHDFDTFKDVMANTTLQPWCDSNDALMQRVQLKPACLRYLRMEEEVGASSRVASEV